MATLRPMRWINDSIVNFVEKVLIQPWRGQGMAKVHVYSSHMMDRLLSGTDPTDPYNFAAVGRWCDRVPGGISNIDEICIPLNPIGNHWNFIRVRMQTKRIELWDFMRLRTSNTTYSKATKRFVKDVMAREVSTGRAITDQGRQEGWQYSDMSRDSPR